MADPYDVIVIGSGPGGYVGAIRAAQLGLRTAVVESDTKVGGRCLNYACIPAKTVLHSADVYEEATEGAAELGVKVKGVSVDWPTVQARREEVSAGLSNGVAGLFKNHKIDLIEGEGSLAGGG
jgi:dihydrolipoamide dehydrogenase